MCCQRNPFYSTMLLYTYISRFSVTPNYQQREKIRQSYSHKFYPPTAFHRVFQLLAQTPHVRFHEQKWVHTRLSEKDRTQRLTRRNRWRFGWGWYHYSRSVPHIHQHPRAGCQNGILSPFWVLAEGAPEERREPRDSDALMRVAAPRRRGPAGLRDLFATW